MTEYKTVGILSALDVESRIILDEMTEARSSVIAGMTFTEGKIGGKDCVLATCGVSKVNAALFTQIMTDHFRPDCIIFTGVAGSMDDHISQMDLVVADRLTFYDIDPRQLELCFPYQVYFSADKELAEKILSNAPEAKQGLIITGDQFITSDERRKELKENFPDALAVEMEGCAVAQACFVNGIPFAIIRCITDKADDGATESYQEFEKLAAERSASVIIKTVNEL